MIALRIDKWLWAARFYKTRSLAKAAVEAGRVRLNGERVKASRELRVADLVEVSLGETIRQLSVEALSDKRGPAPVARKLYAENEASRSSRAAQAELRRLAVEPARGLHGRPTKHDRRALEKLREAIASGQPDD